MSEFRSALKAYDLESALASDRGDRCIVINVGHDEKGQSACSLRRVLEQVHQHLQHVHTPTSAATKLYIIGTWSPTPSEAEAMSEAAEVSASSNPCLERLGHRQIPILSAKNRLGKDVHTMSCSGAWRSRISRPS
jgi:hypothetical protein